MGNPFSRLRESFTYVTPAKIGQFFAILLLIGAIPLTVFIAEKQQQTESNAAYSGSCPGVGSQIDPGNTPPGDYWAVQSCHSGCSFTSGGGGCPQNTNDACNIVPSSSAWCYGFSDGPGCLMLHHPGTDNSGSVCTALTPVVNTPTPIPEAPGCNPSNVNMSVSSNPVQAGQAITFNISGSEGSTFVSDDFGGGTQGSCNMVQPLQWPTHADCTAISSGGTFTWVHYWKNCANNNCSVQSGQCSKQFTYTVQAPTPTPTPTPSPTPSPTPTPTNVPTPTFTPTPTPTAAPNSTMLGFSLTLIGIGAGGANQNPIHTTRNATVCLYPLTIDPSGDPNCANIPANLKVTGTVAYDASSGTFTNTSFNAGTTISSGQYVVLIKVDNFLRKRLGTVQTITAGTTNALGSAILLGGDIDNSNIIDINDFNDFLACYSAKFTSPSCLFKPHNNITGADINDDGKVDGVDYNLFERSLQVQVGD